MQVLFKLNWNLQMLFYQEGGKLENPERNPWNKVRTNNKLSSHMAPSQNQIQETFIWWEGLTCITAPSQKSD